jgi:hypothetical protein
MKCGQDLGVSIWCQGFITNQFDLNVGEVVFVIHTLKSFVMLCFWPKVLLART